MKPEHENLNDIEKYEILSDPDYDDIYPIDDFYPYELDLLYRFNKRILINLDFNSLPKITQNHICNRNINFDIDKYWNELTDMQKSILINKRPIECEKYWYELTYSLKTDLLISHKNIDIDKYWDDIELSQIVHIVDKKFELTYEKISKFIDGLLLNSSVSKNFFLYEIYDTIMYGGNYLKIYVDNNNQYNLNKMSISQLDGFRQQIFIEYLKRLKIKKISNIGEMLSINIDINYANFIQPTPSFIYNDQPIIYKYEDNYFISIFELCILDFDIVLREEKLKRILNYK